MRFTLLTKFSLISLALFITIGALLGWGLTTHFEQQSISQRMQEMKDLVQPVVGDHITPQVLSQGAKCDATLPPEEKERQSQCQWYRKIESALSSIGGSGLVRVKVWNQEGMLVYSDMEEGKDVGQYFPVSASLQQAIDGEPTAAIIKPDKEENIFERGYGELLEIYAPIYPPGETDAVSGVFEGYYDVDELRERVDFTNGYLWTSIATGFLFLYVSLFTLVRNASQRMLRQSHENAMLLADTERKAMRLETLNELARSINESSLNLEGVFNTALRGIDRIVSHNGASITLLEDGADEKARIYLSRLPERDGGAGPGRELAAKRSLLGGKTIYLAGNTRQKGSPFLKSLAARGVHSYMLVSINLQDRQLGLLELESKSREAFDEEDATILKAVADQLAIAIENTRLIQETAETTALRETNRLKDEFVSMVSHELRTPLSSIKGYALTLLAADANWDESTRQEFVSIIAEESDKLSDLVENLLEMSRIEAGRVPITPEPMLLQRFCRSVVERVSVLHPELKFGCAVPKDLPLAEADPRRVEQVLVNLLQNAAKYSEGDLILVRARYDEGSAEVILCVEDNGVGIAPEHLPHIFDKFYRIEHAASESTSGTGLGLSIAQKLVEAQGGRIWVESKVGTGTTFLFTLPVVPGEENVEREPSEVGAEEESKIPVAL
jgi:signal transduction histidine kinase